MPRAILLLFDIFYLQLAADQSRMTACFAPTDVALQILLQEIQHQNLHRAIEIVLHRDRYLGRILDPIKLQSAYRFYNAQ